jgi:UDP:flavonoid glycosyltransferase YjiC (YdhE family)
MRVLFIPLSVPTHYFHEVPLAWACRAAGHDVRVAGQPAVIEAITGSGMVAAPVGIDFDFIAAMARSMRTDGLSPEDAHRQREAALDEHAHAAEAMARDLVRYVRWWRPDLVVADPFVVTAPVAAETAGVPLVRHLFGPDVMRFLGLPGSGVPIEGDVRAASPARIVELFDRFGVEVRADYAARTVDPCPPSMQIPIPNRVPLRYVPYNGPGVLPDWLSQPAERPRVCVTWGTVTANLKGRQGYLVPEILKALAGFDVEIVAAVKASDRELLGELPPRVKVVHGLPLHLLLPTCDAIVHHGGSGAMLTAASFGVPQVVMGQIADQILNGAQLAATGAGVALPPGEADVDAVKAAAATILTEDAPREAARRLKEEILAQPTPADVVGTLEELL